MLQFLSKRFGHEHSSLTSDLNLQNNTFAGLFANTQKQSKPENETNQSTKIVLPKITYYLIQKFKDMKLSKEIRHEINTYMNI